jgi:hypothetical protein
MRSVLLYCDECTTGGYQEEGHILKRSTRGGSEGGSEWEGQRDGQDVGGPEGSRSDQ